MKVLLGVGGSGMLLGSLYASDALTSDHVYDIPLEQAYAELSTMPVSSALIPAAIGTAAPTVAIRRSTRAVDWRFHVKGREVAVVTAHLTSVDLERTRILVKYTPQEPSSPELRHFASATLTHELARLAMTEQVEAHLEGRPVDHSQVADALARHAAAHPQQVEDYGRAMGKMVSGLYSQANETAREATPAASVPSLEPPHYESDQ